MCLRLTQALGLAALLLALAPEHVLAQGGAKTQPAANDAQALAARLDKIIDKRLQKEKIKAGPKADDSTLVRRLHIDLTGRIPTLLEIRDYLDNDSPTKWAKRVDDLLASPLFAANFTHYYRSVLLTGTNNVQAQAIQGQFEGWLHGKLTNSDGFDKIAHEIVSAPVNRGGFSPSGFAIVNENKPENLAGASARVFLGVKIECAQCHKHPFAKWTRQQFWEYAAFFSEIQQQPVQPKPKGGGPVPNKLNRGEIRIPDSDKIVAAKFITGESPDWKDNPSTRTVLADWMTGPKNPFFAKAAADHVWQYFFGVSLTEPVFEPSDDTIPAHPELLDELAKSFIASGYDIKFLIKAVVLTEAYQRISVSMSQDNRDAINFFAKMPIRGMMPEQLFDCFAEAADFRQDINFNDPNRTQFRGLAESPRQQFLNKFTSQDKRIETQTSILQALYLMNGKLLAEHTKLENNEALKTIATAPTPTARRVETLYLMVLSRLPRPDETSKMVRYIESGGGTNDPAQAVADVFWALLNSSEFMLNH
ncbi:MAG TPA: DUF1549 domain-containing protein [Gemmataceae bacterium]|nr:DUF1549 domain-containing protein [Gemmataceae bacterium]